MSHKRYSAGWRDGVLDASSTRETWVGERQRVRNRTTHTTVVLVDTLEEPQWMDSEPGRWATVCDEHSNLVNHQTLSVARAWLHYPQGWCEACMKLTFPETPDPSGGTR